MAWNFRRIGLAALLLVTPLVDPGCSAQPDRQYFDDLQADSGPIDGSSGTDADGTGGAGGTPVAGSGGRDASPDVVITDAADVGVGGADGAMGGSGGVSGAGGTDAGPGVCGDG